MKIIIKNNEKFLLIILIFFSISCKKEVNSNPNQLSKVEIADFKNKIVRYYEEQPKNTTLESKWDSIHNNYYSKKADASELFHYYKNEDGFIYFTIAKIAPSLKLKKVATIGKLKIVKDSIVYYEEIARTWKMEIPELKQKTKILFDLIARNEKIDKYFTKNSQPEFWIEFPDDYTYFDTISRNWKLKN